MYVNNKIKPQPEEPSLIQRSASQLAISASARAAFAELQSKILDDAQAQLSRPQSSTGSIIIQRKESNLSTFSYSARYTIQIGAAGRAAAAVAAGHGRKAANKASAVAAAQKVDNSKDTKSNFPENEHIPRGFSAFLRSMRLINAVFVAGLVIIPLLIVFTTWAIGFGASSDGMVTLLKNSQFGAIFNQIAAVVQQTEQHAQSFATLMASYGINATSSPTVIDNLLQQAFLEVLKPPMENHGVIGMMLGLPDGSERGIIQDPKNASAINRYRNWYSENPTTLEFVPYSDINNNIVDWSGSYSVPYSISVEGVAGDWWKVGTNMADVANGRAKWTHSYVDFGFGVIFTSIVVPIRNSNGTVMSIADVDTISVSLSSTLKSMLANSPGTVAFIADTNTGYLVAASTKSDTYIIDTVNQRVTRYEASEFTPEPLVQAIGKGISAQFGRYYEKLPLVEGMQTGTIQSSSLTVSYNGQAWLVTAAVLKRNGMQWAVVAGMEQIQFTSSIVAVSIVAAAIAVIFLFISIGAGIVFASLAVRPFVKMVSQFRLVEQMRLTEIAQKYSFFAEEAMLQAYFFKMVDRLKLYRSFLPQNLLDSLDSAEQEQDEDDDDEGLVRKQSTAHSIKNHNNSKHKYQDEETSSSKDGSAVMKHHSKARLGLGLEWSDNVTLVSINLDNMANFFETDDMSVPMTDVSNMYGEVLDCVTRQTRDYKGQVISFGEQRMTLMWTENVRKAQLKAIMCASAILEQINKINSKFTDIHVDASVVVVTGSALVGNIGSASQRQFSVLGKTISQIPRLQTLCKAYGCRILVDRTTMREVQQDFMSRPLPDLSRFILPHVALRLQPLASTDLEFNQEVEDVMKQSLSQIREGFGIIRDSVLVYEVGPPTKSHNDEWMYKMTTEQSAVRWGHFNEAIALMMKNDIAGAQRLIETHLVSLEQAHKLDPVRTISHDRAAIIIRMILHEISDPTPLGTIQSGLGTVHRKSWIQVLQPVSFENSTAGSRTPGNEDQNEFVLKDV